MVTLIIPTKIKEGLVGLVEIKKVYLKKLINKKILWGLGLSPMLYVCWTYTDLFSLPNKCYEVQPSFNSTIYIKNPNQGWRSLKGYSWVVLLLL